MTRYLNGTRALMRIMTVHKSKGLEAPVVFVPFTGLNITVSDKPMREERQGLSMMVRNQKALGRPYYEELARQARESINLLYVAFTRARDALYVFRTAAKQQSPVLAGLDILWDRAGWQPPYTLGSLPPAPEADAVGNAEQPSGAPVSEEALCAHSREGACAVQAEPIGQAAAAPAPAAAPPAPEDWRPMQWLPRLKIFRNPLEAFAFRPKDRGNLLHFCLEHLRITGNPQKDAQAALHFGLRHYPLTVPDEADIHQGVTEALRWFASQPQSARWLANGWPEHSIMTDDGHLLRMDLLVRERWGTLVLDYKSGQPDAEHVEQVRKYLACLNRDEDKEQTSARGLLVYLDQQRFRLVTLDGTSELVSDCQEVLPTEEGQS